MTRSLFTIASVANTAGRKEINVSLSLGALTLPFFVCSLYLFSYKNMESNGKVVHG